MLLRLELSPIVPACATEFWLQCGNACQKSFGSSRFGASLHAATNVIDRVSVSVRLIFTKEPPPPPPPPLPLPLPPPPPPLGPLKCLSVQFGPPFKPYETMKLTSELNCVELEDGADELFLACDPPCAPAALPTSREVWDTATLNGAVAKAGGGSFGTLAFATSGVTNPEVMVTVAGDVLLSTAPASVSFGLKPSDPRDASSAGLDWIMLPVSTKDAFFPTGNVDPVRLSK